MFKTLNDLCQFLELSPKALGLDGLNPHFPVKVPLHYAQQIQKQNAHDPLLKQVLPSHLESLPHPGFNQDPVGDLAANPIPSLIHKYQGRALLITSPRCDIHCRYCFRQHFPYEQVKKQNWQQALTYLQANTNLNEVILSGGDPFTLSETALVDLAQQIEHIPHIRTLRIHSRTPIAAPNQSPQKAFLNWANTTPLNLVLVTHCNHPNELSEQTAQLMQTYQQANLTLLNQTVLLKDINDQAETLITLSQALFQQGILPYYCHLLDRVSGSAHFEVPETEAIALWQQIRTALPGYLVPKLVREIAGQPNKTPIA